MLKALLSSEIPSQPNLSSTFFSSPQIPEKHVFNYKDLAFSSERGEFDSFKRPRISFDTLASVVSGIDDGELLHNMDEDEENQPFVANQEREEVADADSKKKVTVSDMLLESGLIPETIVEDAVPITTKPSPLDAKRSSCSPTGTTLYRRRIPMTMKSDHDEHTIRITIDRDVKVFQLEATIKSFLESQDAILEPEDTESICWVKDGRIYEWGALREDNIFTIDRVLIKITF